MNVLIHSHSLTHAWKNDPKHAPYFGRRRKSRKQMDKRQKSAAYLDGLVSANTSVSKYADPIAAEPSDALAPALEHVLVGDALRELWRASRREVGRADLEDHECSGSLYSVGERQFL